jgi:hypothetical protein
MFIFIVQLSVLGRLNQGKLRWKRPLRRRTRRWKESIQIVFTKQGVCVDRRKTWAAVNGHGLI